MDKIINETQIRDIGKIQLEDKFQLYTRASTYLYSQAKLITTLQILFTVIIPIILSFLTIIFSDVSDPNSILKVVAPFYGMFITLIDLAFFDNLQKDFKKRAAKIQECFDSELLLMDWNYFKVGDKPVHEDVIQTANSLKRELTAGEKNWYSSILSNLPLYLCRVASQRTNIWWDGEVRRKYTKYLTTFLLIIISGAVGIGLLRRMPMDFFILAIFAPIFPTIVWLIKERKKQKETIELLDRLMKYAEELWNNAVILGSDPIIVAEKSRELQNELFIHRSSNQPIANRIHKSLSKGLDTSMNRGAEELVQQANLHLSNKANNLIKNE